MTNFEYYKNQSCAIRAYSTQSGEHVYNIGEGKQAISSGRFVDWLYEEYCDKNTLKESAKELIREITMFGITRDTMATDRLYKFIKALKMGNEEERKYGDRIEHLDVVRDGDSSTRNKAVTYALIIIGHIFKGIDFFEEIALERKLYVGQCALCS